MFRDCYRSQVNMATTDIVGFTHLSKSPTKSCCMLRPSRTKDINQKLQTSRYEITRLVACLDLKEHGNNLLTQYLYVVCLRVLTLARFKHTLCFVEPEIWKFGTSCREIVKESVIIALLLSCWRVACLNWHLHIYDPLAKTRLVWNTKMNFSGA